MKLCFYLATKNKNKVKEIKDIMGENFEILLPPKDLEFPEEKGNTLHENAYIKAEFLLQTIGPDNYIVGEDSGLFVEKLNGLPGVNSATFSGKRNDKENIKKLLKMMKEISKKEDRKAKFITVCCLLGKGIQKFFTGEIEGYITFEPRGANGFGYDPIFEIPIIGKTFAELSVHEKNRISHRAIAFLKLKEFLEKTQKKR